jgi:undecaprenyl-diphosphatase
MLPAVSVLEAIVLGAVQGFTEFVPVSSSGHLVVVPELFGWDKPGLAFDVLLHAASLVALIVYFWSDLVALIRNLTSGAPEGRRLSWLLVLGSVPAGLAGLAFGDFFEEKFEDPPAAALTLLLTAAILVAAEQVSGAYRRRAEAGGAPFRGIDDLRWPDSLGVGVAQALAILPGISRSGATIGAGLGLRMERDSAARFAFLLAIPALAGAALVQLPELDETSLGLGAGVAGFAASAVTSYVSIAGLLRYLRRRTLYPFAAYCALAAPIFYVLVR